MKVFSKPLRFEWDSGNDQKSWKRHEVGSQESEEVFENFPNFVFPDTKHSKKEKRHGIFGITNEGRQLTGVFTMRRNMIRVITIRDMSKKERKVFQKLLKGVDKHE